MAIVKGLNENAVIWKTTRPARRIVNDPNVRWRPLRDENGNYVYQEYTEYLVFTLYNRRARTNGVTIDKPMKPFFDKLKIRLNGYAYGREHEPQKWTAVGCTYRTVTEDEYNNTEIDEVAQTYYQKMVNQDMRSLMTIDPLDRSSKILNELHVIKEEAQTEPHEIIEEMEATGWPPEPQLHEYDMELYEMRHFNRGRILRR